MTEFLGFFEIQDECSAGSRDGRGCPEPAVAMAMGMVKGQPDRGAVWVCQGHIDGLVERGLEPQLVGRVCVRREDGKTPCGRAATHVMAIGRAEGHVRALLSPPLGGREGIGGVTARRAAPQGGLCTTALSR